MLARNTLNFSMKRTYTKNIFIHIYILTHYVQLVQYSVGYVVHLKTELVFFLCFVDRASRYNRVKKNQLDAQLILSTFRHLYMFRAYLGPSSGGTTVCIQQVILIIIFR